MALRNQPYLPLYVNDFISDEKLIRCSAETTGVYIRLLCQMHKSEEYGKFIIKDKDKKSDNVVEDFAKIFGLYAPYSFDVIFNSLNELIEEGILFIDGNKLCQKRMIKDNELSEKRAISGKMGANIKYGDGICHSKSSDKSQANTLANAEYEYDNKDEDNNINIILNYYNNNINNNMGSIEVDSLEHWRTIFSDDIVKYAMDIAIANKVRKIKYIEAILKNWQRDGYKTLADIKENELKRENKEEVKELFDYDWINEEEK